MRITVVGAGIIGLSAALRLRRAGHRVTIFTEDPPERTTSSVAAALWLPYLVYPEDKALRWSETGLAVLRRLADDPATGVRLRRGRELYRNTPPDPPWTSVVDDARHLTPQGLPEGYAHGIELTAPLIDMSVHLPWLVDRAARSGIEIVNHHVSDLSTVDGDLVLNCTGLGARQLCGDESMTPIRGQVVLVEQCGLDEWIVDDTDEEHPSYVIPREKTVVCGGTALPGRDDVGPDPDEARRILHDCAILEPKLRRAPIVRHVVGLRPARTEVRLELDGRVLHCYGHGGGGVTLAYGCAEDIVAIVESL